jgi:hypothetical protein
MKIIEGFEFPIDIDETSGKIKTVDNNKTVKQSINMILKTQIMEHKIFKNYGSELKSFMFDIVDSNYIYSFKKTVENSLKRWEPHINKMTVSVKSNSGPSSEIEANIEYTTDISPVMERTKRTININNG